jgi:hypothetical protein
MVTLSMMQMSHFGSIAYSIIADTYLPCSALLLPYCWILIKGNMVTKSENTKFSS